MNDDPRLTEWMKKTKVLRPPVHALATFGTTSLRYILISPLSDGEGTCRLREGNVTAERPQIVTPDQWKQRFEGFGDDTEGWADKVANIYGDAFRSLEYRFKNELSSTSVEHAPLIELADRTRKVLDDQKATRTALLEGPDQAWTVSVMKFIVETSIRSFPSNVKELDERGLFNPERRADERRRAEVERLFRSARADASRIKPLGEFLKDTGLFSEYEDRFFALLR